jgi:hypothetical protein
VIVKAGKETGKIVLRVKAEGLQEAQTVITTE